MFWIWKKQREVKKKKKKDDLLVCELPSPKPQHKLQGCNSVSVLVG